MISVSSVTVLAEGQILVGGYFDTFNGEYRWRVARLQPDGTIDIHFTPADIDPISGNNFDRLLAVQPGGRPLLTGYGNNEAGELRNAFVRLNLDGVIDKTFMGSSVVNRFNLTDFWSALARPDGKLLIVANSQKRPDGSSGGLLLGLDANGAIEPESRPVYLSALYNKGSAPVRVFPASVGADPERVLVGGSFGQIDGQAQHYLARLDLTATDQTSKLSLRLRELLASEGDTTNCHRVAHWRREPGRNGELFAPPPPPPTC